MNQEIANRIRKNLIDLKRKNLLPKHTEGYFGEHSMAAMVKQTELQVFKEWSCPVCAISVYGSKKVLIEHHKIHSQKRELGDNETYQLDFKLY